ncbi:MAG TPA: hypothetical protein VGJ71_06365 [Candidatus Limnocylindrales bacterium]|jgi:hypothetical protein
MQAFAIGSSADDPGFQGEEAQPVLELEGVEGSSLRATLSGIVIRSCPTGSAGTEHRWSDDQLGPVRIDAYGPIGVIRATILPTGNELPMLLLEPNQIAAARRGLEMIWNLMGSRANAEQPA